MTRLFCMAVLAALLAGGCVVPYDPATEPRFGIEPAAPAPDRIGAPTVAEAEAAPPVAESGVASPVPPPAAAPAASAPETPAGRQLEWLTGVLGGAPVERPEQHLAPSLLERVPPPEFRRIVRQWRRDEFGDGAATIVEVAESSPHSLAALLRGRAGDRHTQVRLQVDESGRIATLWLAPLVGARPGEISEWDRLDARLRELPGAASLSASELTGAGPRSVHTFSPAASLAIGGTAKLYIAGTIAEMILAGEASWDDVIVIRDEFKSLPPGRLQLEREGAEVPLSRAMELMLSLGDNTAADHLLHRAGRERVEAFMRRLNAAPQRNTPFLATMEYFRLKLSPQRRVAHEFLSADSETRREMLAPGGPVEQAPISPSALLIWKRPYLIEEVQWFATAPESAALMADLHRLEREPAMEPLAGAMRLNPGLQFESSLWRSIASANGSEPGVISWTWLLERDDGRWFTLSVTWNDPREPVDLRRMTELASAAVALLGREGR